MALAAGRNRFSRMLKERRHRFDAEEILQLFKQVDEERVEDLAGRLVGYISVNLPAAFEKRNGLSDYRTNPYVLMTAASVMNLSDPAQFGKFLFDSKLYMALETSFGKQIEAAFVGRYPLRAEHRWTDAPEKVAEFAELEGLDRETRAQRRIQSVWREIDRSCVVGNRRFLTSIKSGPNTINDTQVAGMDDPASRRARLGYAGWLMLLAGTDEDGRSDDLRTAADLFGGAANA